MAREDAYREWNGLQELRAHLKDIVGEEKAGVYAARLNRILQPEAARVDLDRAVLQAWGSLGDSEELVYALRVMLGYESLSYGTRLDNLPGEDVPIHPGPLFCCATPGCGGSLYQLFDGQRLTCPICKAVMSNPCQDGRRAQP